MATSLTKKGLIVASDKVIVAARPALELVSQFTTDFSDDAVKPGTGIAVDVVTATAADFNASTNNYGTNNGNVKPCNVPVNIRKKSTFGLEDLDCLDDETSHLWDKFGPVAGRAVGAELVKAVTALLTDAAKTGTVSLSAESLAGFFGLRAGVEAAKIDPATCSLLLSPEKYSLLCSLLNAGIVGDGSIMRGAQIGAALGFKGIYSAPTCTFASGTVGYVVPQNAVAVAGRVVKPMKGKVGGLVEYGEATDELTGLTLSHRVVYNALLGECYWTAEGLFGAALTKQNGNGAPGFYAITAA